VWVMVLTVICILTLSERSSPLASCVHVCACLPNGIKKFFAWLNYFWFLMLFILLQSRWFVVVDVVAAVHQLKVSLKRKKTPRISHFIRLLA